MASANKFVNFRKYMPPPIVETLDLGEATTHQHRKVEGWGARTGLKLIQCGARTRLKLTQWCRKTRVKRLAVISVVLLLVFYMAIYLSGNSEFVGRLIRGRQDGIEIMKDPIVRRTYVIGELDKALEAARNEFDSSFEEGLLLEPLEMDDDKVRRLSPGEMPFYIPSLQ